MRKNAPYFTFMGYDDYMANFNKLPSIRELTKLFSYDPETGLLTRIRTKKTYTKPNKNGYLVCHIKGKQYRVHRIIWKMCTLQDPGDLTIDHIDNDPTNNRLENLRLANQVDQNYNKQRKPKGYRWDKKRNRFIVFITINGRYNYLGSYREEEDAIERFSEVYEEMIKNKN